MKRLLLFCFLALTSCLPSPVLEPPRPLPSLDKAIVQLDIQTETSLFSCSGALVGPSVVVTAAHCIVDSREALSIKVYPGGDVSEAVSAISWEPESCYSEPVGVADQREAQRCDFAVVFLSEPLGNRVGWLRPSLPQEGVLYSVRGWPLDSEPLDDMGLLIHLGGLLYYRMEAKKGMSGGPIYREGKIVGLITWTAPNYNIGSPMTPERIEYLGVCNRRAALGPP